MGLFDKSCFQKVNLRTKQKTFFFWLIKYFTNCLAKQFLRIENGAISVWTIDLKTITT